MTVTYTTEVATCTGYGCFLKLLRRWRGSIYKIIWVELLLFLTVYYAINLMYRYVLDEQHKHYFESTVEYCERHSTLIPLAFVLGFYVALVMKRWWNQYLAIPWPDPSAVFVSALLRGQDDRSRMMRRTIMRYLCLSLVLVFRHVSPNVKKRFATMDTLIESGYLLENEKIIFQHLQNRFSKHAQHWLPIVWATMIVTRARKEGRIWDDCSLMTIISELDHVRFKSQLLLHYDLISIPLVYTQVVTLAVYSYFITEVMAQQWTEKMDENGYWNTITYYFPIFATLEFFFYMGWLKVAESLINPFGPDDDDFDAMGLVDRSLPISYLIVDEMHHYHPELVKDQYWDDIFPQELPYPKEMEGTREETPGYSTAKVSEMFKEPITRPVSRAPSEHDTPTKTGSQMSMRSMKRASSASTVTVASVQQHTRSVISFDMARATIEEESNVETETELDIDQVAAIKARARADTTDILSPRESFRFDSESDGELDAFEQLREQRQRERLVKLRNNMEETLQKVASIAAVVTGSKTLQTAAEALLGAGRKADSAATVDVEKSEEVAQTKDAPTEPGEAKPAVETLIHFEETESVEEAERIETVEPIGLDEPAESTEIDKDVEAVASTATIISSSGIGGLLVLPVPRLPFADEELPPPPPLEPTVDVSTSTTTLAAPTVTIGVQTSQALLDDTDEEVYYSTVDMEEL